MTERFPSSGLPSAQGLYDPRHEHDACGIGFVANIEGRKSHDIVLKGIQILINLTHRGACGCDPQTGDGAGILIQIPHAFFERECSRLGFTLPAPGEYGVGMVFLPVEPQRTDSLRRHHRENRAGRGPHGSRVARYAGQRQHDRATGARLAALHRADFPAARGRDGSGRARTQALRGAQAGGSGRRGDRLQGERLLLSAFALFAHDYLQGPAARAADHGFLQGAAGSGTSPARCAWCTSASRPTRFRAGSSRTRTATSATTARSTRCAEI